MERTQPFDLTGELKLYGMKPAFDKIMATVVKRQHEHSAFNVRHQLECLSAISGIPTFDALATELVVDEKPQFVMRRGWWTAHSGNNRRSQARHGSNDAP